MNGYVMVDQCSEIPETFSARWAMWTNNRKPSKSVRWFQSFRCRLKWIVGLYSNWLKRWWREEGVYFIWDYRFSDDNLSISFRGLMPANTQSFSTELEFDKLVVLSLAKGKIKTASVYNVKDWCLTLQRRGRGNFFGNPVLGVTHS
jgi:hypothetical protein